MYPFLQRRKQVKRPVAGQLEKRTRVLGRSLHFNFKDLRENIFHFGKIQRREKKAEAKEKEKTGR